MPGILVIPVLAITRQQLAARIARRGRRLEFFQIRFEKMVGDDQRLDRLAGKRMWLRKPKRPTRRYTTAANSFYELGLLRLLGLWLALILGLRMWKPKWPGVICASIVTRSEGYGCAP